ncbi:MAG: cupin domain-containing protein [Acidimicrobiia bacterium]
MEEQAAMTGGQAGEPTKRGTDPEASDSERLVDPFFEVENYVAAAHDLSGASIVHMDDYPSYEIAEGLFFRPVFAQNMSLNFVTFPPDSGFPSHVHPEEQISIVQEGEMEITIGDSARKVRPGDVIVFPPNVPHAGRTDDLSCRLIDIFSPPRQGMREVVAAADAVRSAEVDRWWSPDEDTASPDAANGGA